MIEIGSSSAYGRIEKILQGFEQQGHRACDVEDVRQIWYKVVPIKVLLYYNSIKNVL